MVAQMSSTLQEQFRQEYIRYLYIAAKRVSDAGFAAMVELDLNQEPRLVHAQLMEEVVALADALLQAYIRIQHAEKVAEVAVLADQLLEKLQKSRERLQEGE